MVESASNLTNNPSSEADFSSCAMLFPASGGMRESLICPVPEISSCQACRPRHKLRTPKPAQMKHDTARMTAKPLEMPGSAPNRKAEPNTTQPAQRAAHRPNSLFEGRTTVETAMDIK